MSAARPRRLPGFRFETVAPVLPETLPRMDIAVFVGFSASGPLEIPVAVESEAQFTAIFGEDAPLAWDIEKGEQVYAHLPPAVRAFFRNGGRRCWIIRVARRTPKATNKLNRAVCNYFPIPSLVSLQFGEEKEDNKLTRVAPAFALARSEGSWSDSIRVGSALLSRPSQVSSDLEFVDGKYVVHLIRDSSEPVAPGELLKLDFQKGRTLFLTVAKVELPVSSSPPTDSELNRVLKVTGEKAAWVFTPKNLPLPGSKVQVGLFTHELDPADSSDIDPAVHFEVELQAIINPDQLSPVPKQTDKISLKLLNCAVADAPAPGSIIRITAGNDELLMTVSDLTFSSDATATPLVSGQPVLIKPAPMPIPASTPSCERLAFEIWVRKGDEYAVSLSELGFEKLHPRYWSNLPSDEEVYSDTNEVMSESPATVLWRQVGDLFRFPLAGLPAGNEMHLPLAMLPTPANYVGPATMTGNELERDGLAEFDANLFIDPSIASVVTENLPGEAEFLSYLAPKPRRLTGMHAAFALEEATIIAVPDAVHAGWTRQSPPKLPKPEPSTPPVRPGWWHFLNCNATSDNTPPPLTDCAPKAPKPSPIKPVHAPEWGQFLDCSIQVIDSPVLVASTQLSADGTFTLSWKSSSQSAQLFVLEESGDPDFSNHEEIYSGKSTSYTIYGRKNGDYYYRVRTIVGHETSDWSNGVAVRVGTSGRWRLTREKEYSATELFSVQRALLRLCAARGDLLCVLSLPKHYREDKAIEHVRILKSNQVVANALVPALGFRETNAFSYGAVFHPWLIASDEPPGDGLRSMPPCGAMCGLIAKRALRRGAWLAPANDPMLDVLALEPELASSRRLDLQESHINLIRHEPRGFLVLDADTLSDDIDLRSINVRRLLILLRRQALRLGATYVFEPNNDAFRRVVERGFTEMLDGMFERGAFAGSTPASSYQVVAGDSLNTPESVEQGRFIVELRVAPSLPLSFLTIRLIQTSDRSLAMEVR
ncbi:MAG TPA: hypothetical protein VJU86_21300 [Pyrinomonadaceae bacterium]|nr:hypothetical protein [Pyrinomonadaceae bacterium]